MKNEYLVVGGLALAGLGIYLLTRTKPTEAEDVSTLTITVMDSETIIAVPEATVSMNGQEMLTDASGIISLTVPRKTYAIRVTKSGYQELQTSIDVLVSVVKEILYIAPLGSPSPPPPVPDPEFPTVSELVDGEFAPLGLATIPHWKLGDGYWQMWLDARISTYRKLSINPAVDPSLAAIYGTVADELQVIKDESKALWDAYAASGVMGGYNSIYAAYRGCLNDPGATWRVYQLIAIADGLKTLGIWEDVLALLDADFPGISVGIEQMIASV